METPIDAGQTGFAASPMKARAENRDATQSLNKRTRPTEIVVSTVLLFCGVISIFTTIGIVFVLGQEALHFFDSRAWVLARAPVADAESSATLTTGIDASERQFAITFEGERVPYNNEQFIRIGAETMQIVERGRSTITVQRGADGTTASAHTADEAVFGMTAEQIKPQNDLTAETAVIELPEDFGREFESGMLIQLNLEVMRVTEATMDTITVERGVLDTTAAEHDADDDAFRLEQPVSIGEFLTSTSWSPQVGQFGIWPLLNSTLLITFVALIVAIPLGLGAAIYLSEYASDGVRSILKPVLEILAGIPTVVFGFFALTFVTPTLRVVFGDAVGFYNILAAGIVVGILLVPMISSMGEDALSAVPRALREASYGLGATRLETTVKVVLPAAISGIVAAVILAMSRAVGETMIVAIAAGSGPNFTFNLFEGAETITGHIARISGGDITYNSIAYNSLFALGLVLFLITLVLNIISGWIARRLREEY
ncbi:MAG: phosphate ABC transporter permease subunit PstC [Aggregatilineales bacterium]